VRGLVGLPRNIQRKLGKNNVRARTFEGRGEKLGQTGERQNNPTRDTYFIRRGIVEREKKNGTFGPECDAYLGA